MTDDCDWMKSLKIKKLRGRPRKVLKFNLHRAQIDFLKKFGMVTDGGYLLYLEGWGLLAKVDNHS